MLRLSSGAAARYAPERLVDQGNGSARLFFGLTLLLLDADAEGLPVLVLAQPKPDPYASDNLRPGAGVAGGWRGSAAGDAMTTIIVHQRPLEATRTSSKSCQWQGEAIVNGQTYTATSRMAPANDIPRQLVADGVPDTPMEIYIAGLKGCLTWSSFHWAALFTYQETSTKPMRMARWGGPAVETARK